MDAVLDEATPGAKAAAEVSERQEELTNNVIAFARRAPNGRPDRTVRASAYTYVGLRTAIAR